MTIVNASHLVDDISAYVPPGPNGSIISTSQTQKSIEQSLPKEAILYNVEDMEMKEALALLKMLSEPESCSNGDEKTESADEGTQTLISKLGPLASAICQAGIYMRNTNTAPKEFLKKNYHRRRLAVAIWGLRLTG